MIEGFAPGATKLTYNILKHYLSKSESWFEHPKDACDIPEPSYSDWNREERHFRQEIQFVAEHPEYQESREVLAAHFETYSEEDKSRIQALYEERYFPIVEREFMLAYEADKNAKMIEMEKEKITLRKNRNFFVDVDHCFRVYTPNGLRIIVKSKNRRQGDRNVVLITAYVSKEALTDVFVESTNKKQQKLKARDDLEKFLRHIKNVRVGWSQRIH